MEYKNSSQIYIHHLSTLIVGYAASDPKLDRETEITST